MRLLKVLLLGSVVCSSLLIAERNFDGYSYFATGIENFRYSEKFFSIKCEISLLLVYLDLTVKQS